MIINNLIHKYVPNKHSSSSSNFPKWFSKELREFIRKKNEAHWVYKLSADEDDYSEFKRLRAICVRKRKECYAECIRKVENSSFYNVKSFWSLVNSKKKSLGIPNSVFLNNIEAIHDSEISKLFVLHFRTSFTKSNPDLPALNDSPTLCDSMWITDGNHVSSSPYTRTVVRMTLKITG